MGSIFYTLHMSEIMQNLSSYAQFISLSMYPLVLSTLLQMTGFLFLWPNSVPLYIHATFPFAFVCSFVYDRFHYLVKTGLKLTMFLPQPPKCQDYRCSPSQLLHTTVSTLNLL
jgi:hypothetical protein